MQSTLLLRASVDITCARSFGRFFERTELLITSEYTRVSGTDTRAGARETELPRCIIEIAAKCSPPFIDNKRGNHERRW